jgi:DNA mismatch endonuclease (patch repair protein)
VCTSGSAGGQQSRAASTAPAPSDLRTALRMRRQRQADTACELAIRRHLHSWGLRYRVDCRPEPQLPRRADIVFRPAKVAVFVDGCFWHKCPHHWKAPGRNSSWWTDKISANVKRDAETTAVLEASGWTVVRVWEHEDAEAAALDVAELVRARRSGSQPRS